MRALSQADQQNIKVAKHYICRQIGQVNVITFRRWTAEGGPLLHVPRDDGSLWRQADRLREADQKATLD